LRLYADERPRAVIVGWDSLEAPTKRHEMFPAYQSGREFDEDLIEQLGLLPEFVAACGFVNAKAPGFEADDFLAAVVASEERAGGSALVASGDRDSFSLRRARRSSTPCGAAKLLASVLKRSGSDMASIQNRYPTSLRCAAIHPTNCLARPGSGQRAPLN
jgi:5'-3' exonuclease